MSKWKLLLAAGALSLAASLPAAAATLTLDGTTLTGATGVTVATAAGTKTYNVEFLDGSCVTLFTNCGAADAAARPFAFTTSAVATAASQALLDQVFTGAYDTSPALTRGCSSTVFCSVWTPYAISETGFVLVIDAINRSDATIDFTQALDLSPIGSTADLPAVYARWTEVTPIPIPAGVSLVLSGLATLAGLRWQKRRERRRAQV